MGSKGSVIVPMILLVRINNSTSAFICSDAVEEGGGACSGEK